MLVFGRVATMLIIVASFCNVAVAKPPIPPHSTGAVLRADEAADFATFLHAARQKTGASYLIEDVPIHPRLSEDVRKTLQSKFSQEKNIAAQVNLVAGLYDFEVIPITPRFSVWRKRYSDHHDIPNVTSEEMRESIHKLRAFYQMFAPKGLIGPMSFISTDQHRDMVRMLSPEQIQRANSETGLPVRELSAEQKERFWQAMLDFSTSGTRMDLEIVYDNERLLQRDGAQFGYAYLFGKEPQAKNIEYFLPNSDSPKPGWTLVSKEESAPPDLRDETVHAQLAPLSHSLSIFFEKLSLPRHETTTKKSPPLIRFQMEPALTKKTMLFVGEFPKTQSEAKHWVSGVTKSFGWKTQLVNDETPSQIGQTVLQVQRIPPKVLNQREDYARINEVIASLLPEPVLRALLIDEERRLLKEQDRFFHENYNPVPSPNLSPAEREAEWQKRITAYHMRWSENETRLSAFDRRISTLNRTARYRFRDSLHARLGKIASSPPDKKRISVSALTDQEKASFLLGQMYYAMSSVHRWIIATPVYVARFDEQSLTYGPTSQQAGETRFDLGIGSYEGGSFQQQSVVMVNF